MSPPRVDQRARSSLDSTCRALLPKVSRTFALTIRVLPRPLRESVTVAYLLCRLADVLEDATHLDPAPRAAALLAFADALDGVASHDAGSRTGSETTVHALVAPFRAIADLDVRDEDAAELLQTRATVVRAFLERSPAHREIIARWVATMARGMSEFVLRESPADPAMTDRGPAFGLSHVLQTTDELRSYAFYVAGTVGHLLTELFAEHLGPAGRRVQARLTEHAAPFGLGLQFTNILQDLAEDRIRGWSYVPEDLARRHGTSAQSLTSATDRQAAFRVVGDLVHEAARYLDQAVEFTLILPRQAPRIRLFCLWPTFFAMRTLTRVWGEDALFDTANKVRISRGDVRRVIGLTSAACCWDGWIANLYGREKARLRARMDARPV